MFDRLLSACIRAAAASVALGWLLSAFGALDGRGYLWVALPLLVLAAGSAFWGQRLAAFRLIAQVAWARLSGWWRQGRLLPLIYWGFFVLIVAGSLLHQPNNFDGLSYREPKVLHWLEQHRWHWIAAPYPELNYTLPNYEWLTVPLFLATGSFRSTVLINWVAFLLIPPLFFSLLRAWGASGRFAWEWMWFFPSGYIIVMQAGSIGNDLLGLTAFLAALHCARRFQSTGRPAYLFDAVVGAAFCTGIKLSNLPLTGFVALYLLKDWRLLRAQARLVVLAGLVGLLVSALPPMLLNRLHTGTVLGTHGSKDELRNPLVGATGNLLIMGAAALSPPLVPAASQVGHLLERSLGQPTLRWLSSQYPKFELHFSELAQEEFGGLGLGISLGVALCGLVWLSARKAQLLAGPAASAGPCYKAAYGALLASTLLLLLAKLGTGAAVPRNFLPWYPLVLAPLLAGLSCSQLARSPLWRLASPLLALSVLPALLLSPARPLIPPWSILALAQKCHLHAPLQQRLSRVYEIYSQRAEPFKELLAALPAHVRTVGLVSNGMEPSSCWWKPFGSHRIVYLLNPQQLAGCRATNHLEYVLLKDSSCIKYFGLERSLWLQTYHARELKSIELNLMASQAQVDRYTLARFEAATPTAQPPPASSAP